MIALQFPETDEAVLTAIVRRYVEQDTWKTDLIFSEDAFILLQDILEERDLMERYDLLSYKLVHEIQVMNIKEEIQNKVKERVDKHQRDYILREQLKLSKKERGRRKKFSGAFALFYSCNVDKMCALQCSPDPIPNPVAGYPLLDLRDLLFRIGFGSFCHSGENQLVAVVAVI